MTNVRKTGQRGASMLEFVLVGIPMIFIMISIFELARGMWTYQTLAFAVREGTRYASVHGKGCASPNTCQVTIGNIVGVIKTAGPGLDAPNVTLSFMTPSAGTATTDTMTNLSSSTVKYPTTTANSPGQTVKISGSYAFRTVLAVFWAGAGTPLNDSGIFKLNAASSEPIQY